MMTSYFDLLKYAATGIASPSMTYYDKMRESMLMSGSVQTMTGIPPLSFKANGKPLISWSMKGNGSQSGTPTPDNPVMPEFVGTKTANLSPPLSAWVDGYVSAYTGDILSPTQTEEKTSPYIDISGITGYLYMSYETGMFPVGNNGDWWCIGFYTDGKTFISRLASANYKHFLIPDNARYVRISFRTYGYTDNCMLSHGYDPVDYEPYGWKIPITCAGQTVPVYLGQVSTVRKIKKLVLTGEENITKGAFPPSSNCYQFGFTRPADMDANVAKTLNSHFVIGTVTNGSYIGSLYNMFPQKSILPEEATATDFKDWLASQYENGTPVTIWYVMSEPTTEIVNEPLAKIGDYADELHSEDAGVTIPTVKGQNTLTVETELQPSEISITYRG